MSQTNATLEELEPTAPPPWSSRRLMGNIVSLSSGEILARAVAFFGTAWVARKVGPDGFGAIGFAAAICGYLSIAVSAGFNDVGAREVARRPEDAAMLAASASLMRLMLAVAAFIVLAILVPFLDEPATVQWVVLLTGLSFFSLALDGAWVFKGLERNVLVGISLVVAQAIYVIAVVAAVGRPADVIRVPVARFAGDMVAAILLGWSICRLGRLRVHLGLAWHLLKSCGFLTFSRLLRALIFTFDLVVITTVLGTRQAGYYAAAYSICYLLLAVAASTSVSFLPLLARSGEQGAEALGEAAGRAVELAAAIGAPLVAGGAVLAGPILTLVFGSEYIQGGAALSILLGSIGCIFLWGTVHNVVLVRNRTGAETWTIALAATMNVVLNLLLVRRFGLTAAAGATLAAEAVILLLGVWICRGAGVRWRWGPVCRPIAAAAAMGAVVWVMKSHLPLAVNIPLGAAVYGLILLMLGVPQEVKGVLRRL